MFGNNFGIFVINYVNSKKKTVFYSNFWADDIYKVVILEMGKQFKYMYINLL